MTLEEAIAHAKEVAAGNHPDIDGCSECAREHGQLAEWLEDLLRYRRLEEEGYLYIAVTPKTKDDPRPACFYNDNKGELCLGYGAGDDDEPCERCKECWYCESGYFADEREAVGSNV